MKSHHQKSYVITEHVAPFVGAWIEIQNWLIKGNSVVSLPSWERGLKSPEDQSLVRVYTSLPSWERGLKLL